MIRILKKQLKIAYYMGIVVLIAFCFALSVSKNKDRTVLKYKTYYKMLLSWIDLMERGKLLGDYLEKNRYYRVAVYGGYDTGQHLINQLHGTEINVEYIIDRNCFLKEINSLPVYRPDDQLPKVDAIIVTPIWDYQNIEEKLSAKNSCPIISLQKIIEEVKNA